MIKPIVIPIKKNRMFLLTNVKLKLNIFNFEGIINFSDNERKLMNLVRLNIKITKTIKIKNSLFCSIYALKNNIISISNLDKKAKKFTLNIIYNTII